jgi:hypothetical protein
LALSAAIKTPSARSLRNPQKRPPQKALIGIDFCGEGIRNAARFERISYKTLAKTAPPREAPAQ